MEAKNNWKCTVNERIRFTSLQSYTAERDQSLLVLFGP